MTKESPHKLFEKTPASELLLTHLSKIAEAEEYRTITYTELSDLARCDVQHKYRGYLTTARRVILHKLNRVFITLDDVGVRLATHAEASHLQTGVVRHIHRSARKGRVVHTTVILDKLSNREKLQHMASDAVLGLIESGSRAIVAKRIEAKVETGGPKITEATELLKIGGIKQIE